MKKITSFIKVLILAVLFSFTLTNVMAQSYSVTIKVNHLPEIVSKTPSNQPDTFKVCEHIPINLETLYVEEVDTNGVALDASAYTLEFSTDPDFNTTITGPDYNYELTNSTPVPIYARVTMNNSLACSNTFSFVLGSRPEPEFDTQMISVCYGVNVDLTTAVSSIVNGGSAPLVEFSTDSTNFTPIANPEDYDAAALGANTGGDYRLYARVTNTDEDNGCASVIKSFTLHIDAMPTLVLTQEAESGEAEACDGTVVDLESYVASVDPSTGTTLQFSIDDDTFATPISGTAATNYLLTLDNTAQTAITVYVRAEIDDTGCEGVSTGVESFDLNVNPMPKIVVDVNASNSQVCDAATIDLNDYISSSTQGTTLQFSTSENFADTIQGDDLYLVAVGNTVGTQALTFYVRAVNTTTGCVTVADSVKNFTITVNPTPAIQTIAAGLDNGCSNNTISYNIPSASNVTYQWSASGGTLQGSTTENIASVLWGAVNPSAQVQVEYTITTGETVCSRTDVLPVDILQSPTNVNLAIANGGSSEVCDDGTNEIQLEVSVTSGTSSFVVDYSWSPDSGTDSVIISGGSTSTIFTVTPNAGVSYTYTINKVTDANNCVFIPAP